MRTIISLALLFCVGCGAPSSPEMTLEQQARRDVLREIQDEINTCKAVIADKTKDRAYDLARCKVTGKKPHTAYFDERIAHWQEKLAVAQEQYATVASGKPLVTRESK